ncbi:hypothetical protein R3P38DRAFT_2848473 [Favolaschia claudopus]|uniref:Secreted protein n=1 Tax=Favolaschia claudopus TaxID=2862362 RepID=A0AAW0DWX8_9AGAR
MKLPHYTTTCYMGLWVAIPFLHCLCRECVLRMRCRVNRLLAVSSLAFESVLHWQWPNPGIPETSRSRGPLADT